MTDMTIHSIAGYCTEKALWKLLVDVSSELMNADSKDFKVLMPEMVIVDGDTFRINNNPQNHTMEFCPPEGIENYGEKGLVWSLGAVVCYASSGHYVFGGRGGAYQRDHPSVELPTLKKEHVALTALVKRCLCFAPSQRISLDELHAIAKEGFKSNQLIKRVRRVKEMVEENVSSTNMDDLWPEKME